MNDRNSEYPKAAGYQRVSSTTQAGAEHVSLPVQHEKFTQHCAAKHYVPIAEFVDVESGRKDSRKEYQKLLTLARSKHIDVIVVQRLDRFGRNPREILRRVWELQDLGVTVEATDEDLRQEIAMMLHAFMAGEESKRISARVIPTMERAARDGRWLSREPFGYVLDMDPKSPTRGRLTIDEEQAAIVRRIYALYISGHYGFASIARLLNAEGIPSSMGGAWWGARIRQILTVSIYVGRPAWRGIVYPGGCPAIVDEETWQATKAMRQGRTMAWHRQPPNSAFILAGLVRCKCGRKRLCHVPDRRYPQRYYICPVRSQGGSCELKAVRAEKLETFVLETVQGWDIRLPDVAPAREDTGERSHLAAERTRLKAAIERVKRRRDMAYDQLMDQTVSKEDYQSGNRRYLDELAELEAELARNRETTPSLPDARLAITALERFRLAVDIASPGEIREGLALLVERVEVHSSVDWRIIPVPDLASLVSASP